MVSNISGFCSNINEVESLMLNAAHFVIKILIVWRVALAFQPGVVLDVMTLYLGNKFLVRNDTDLLKMWKMSDVESLWDVHFYIKQREEVKPIVEPIVYNIQAQRPKKLVTKPRLKKKKTLLKLVDEEDVEQVQVEVQVPERVQDQEQVYKGKRKKESTTRSEPKTKKTRPSELLEEALDEPPPLYFSDDEVIVENTDVGGNTVGEGVEDMGGSTVDGEHRGGVGDIGVNTDNWSELDPDNLNIEEGYYSTHTSQDGDDGLTQENIDICDLEFRDLAKEYDNIFSEEEDTVHSVPPQPTYGELRVGMEWVTVYECRTYIRQWSIMNKFEYYQEKNENYRVILFCIDENCEWMFYARRTTDGHTFTLRKSSNLKHTCSSGTKNRLANATWVAKKVESVIRSVRTTTPVGIQELISTQFGVDISYYTAWNAWSNLQGEDSRPVVGLDGCFLKGKYGRVCLSAIGLDGNNGLFSLGVYFCRQMYKNMKKVYRGTDLESLVWKAGRVYKQVEKKNLLDELKLENPSTHDWLMKEPFEHWARSHFDFTAKCLVLLPRAQTHIDKLKRQYGQYRIEGTKKGGCVFIWKTYKDAIYPVVDSSEWEQPQPPYFLPSPLVRGPGRPRKERIHDPDEKMPHKRCGTCECFGHSKTTCKGPPVVQHQEWLELDKC
ncbi:hypothetical protein GIB67_038152 [Kingdonia uniflora]|uniref:Transposase MuDR plant domain-containing protein n=1 Tax=Kingdonia uniflora TaxID=39325 RepID=A0A7J7KVM1_9MAGN|nr:hypothetical protein GIB67_038152 [Kingdonia uniflora]